MSSNYPSKQGTERGHLTMCSCLSYFIFVPTSQYASSRRNRPTNMLRHFPRADPGWSLAKPFQLTQHLNCSRKGLNKYP